MCSNVLCFQCFYYNIFHTNRIDHSNYYSIEEYILIIGRSFSFLTAFCFVSLSLAMYEPLAFSADQGSRESRLVVKKPSNGGDNSFEAIQVRLQAEERAKVRQKFAALVRQLPADEGAIQKQQAEIRAMIGANRVLMHRSLDDRTPMSASFCAVDADNPHALMTLLNLNASIGDTAGGVGLMEHAVKGKRYEALKLLVQQKNVTAPLTAFYQALRAGEYHRLAKHGGQALAAFGSNLPGNQQHSEDAIRCAAQNGDTVALEIFEYNGYEISKATMRIAMRSLDNRQGGAGEHKEAKEDEQEPGSVR